MQNINRGDMLRRVTCRLEGCDTRIKISDPMKVRAASSKNYLLDSGIPRKQECFGKPEQGTYEDSLDLIICDGDDTDLATAMLKAAMLDFIDNSAKALHIQLARLHEAKLAITAEQGND